jgi:hypothetical protein
MAATITASMADMTSLHFIEFLQLQCVRVRACETNIQHVMGTLLEAGKEVGLLMVVFYADL